MRRPLVAIARVAFNALYRVRCRAVRAEEVAFISRQADEPSYDFSALAREFESRGWRATMHLKKVTRRNLLGYAGHVIVEIGLLGRCKVVVLDRYDPVVSLIDFEYDCSPATSAPLHDEFPRRPVVLQLWHAFGAYKKFGFQSVDTLEGHAADYMEDFMIHRNYSWVACSGEGARSAFAEALSYPPDRVVPLNRPEFDELVALRGKRIALPARPRVLMAPTLRKSSETAHPFRELYGNRILFEENVQADFDWVFHPLEEGLPAPGNVSKALLGCDVVVTDYSSIVYEAYLLGKFVYFYVPDLEDYRISPGLNCDPLDLAPSLCAFSERQLRALLQLPASEYPADQLEAFASRAFDWTPEQLDADDIPPAAARIADFIEHNLPA